ncbi:signal-regulatory protein beta-1-like [Chrysemys picta bellii]|uniref:signal-regulatory protein beta-1-like n=1 Tax=Chrysemys picta bellii TaxID=8478 RepID=UPI0032B2C725
MVGKKQLSLQRGGIGKCNFSNPLPSALGEGLILNLKLLSIFLDNGELAKAVVLKGRPSDNKMAPLTPVSGLSLPCLVLLLLLEIPGAGAQEFQLLQPQGAVSVSAGETLTLICSLTGFAPVGPVKWFKGSGSGRQLVYAQVGSFPRVTRAVSGSDTDFTIHISDTRPEDAGIYRCVKFERWSGAYEEFRSGAGTVVSVSGQISTTGSGLFSSPALWIGLFLEKVLTAAFLLFLFLRSKAYCVSLVLKIMAVEGLDYVRLNERTRVTSRFAVRREGLILNFKLLSISLDNGELAKAAVLKGRPSDNKMAPSTPVSGLSLPWLVLLLLLEIPGAGAQELQLLQPQGAVWVSPGETLTLTCSVTGLQPVGPVKWFKDSGSGRQLVYGNVGSFPRVTRAVSGSDTDFTIRISDTRPEDAGIYHCVKFEKGSVVDEEIRSGNGTVVSVSARPSAPSVSGPPSRAEPGSPVTFTCTSGGFSPRNITVTWLKNGAKLPAPQPRVLPAHESVSYNMSSTVGVNLTAGDARSQLTCQIEHSTLPAPLRASYNLSAALRVPPRLRVGTAPAAPVALNESVTFTCYAEGFYPKDASLTWLENGNEMNLGKPSPMTQNPDGTYTLQSSLEVKATEQRRQSAFTCRAVHDSQPPVSASAMLRLSQVPADPGKDPTSPTAGQSLFSSPALWIGLFLEKVLTAAFLLFLFQRSKA